MKLFRVSNIDTEVPDHAKCDFCNYRVANRYLMATSEPEVIEMLEGDAADGMEYNGFCGTCMCNMLAVDSSLMGESTEYLIEELGQ
jgi:hypothetical protein